MVRVEAPINGTTLKRNLTAEQKINDQEIRENIANELGNRQVEISASYLA